MSEDQQKKKKAWSLEDDDDDDDEEDDAEGVKEEVQFSILCCDQLLSSSDMLTIFTRISAAALI